MAWLLCHRVILVAGLIKGSKVKLSKQSTKFQIISVVQVTSNGELVQNIKHSLRGYILNIF